jgi:ribonuclease HII
MSKSVEVTNQMSITSTNTHLNMIEMEERLWEIGCRFVCGVDEVGRGPLAGPVVAAAVILPPGELINGVADSKTLTPIQRNLLYDIIMEKALTVGLGASSPTSVDRIGILNATHQAFLRAVSHLTITPDHLLVDGYPIPYRGSQTALIKGDQRCQSIAAASIIAKVTRDRLMIALDPRYPAYGFARHKGYGTAFHREALQRYGPCPIHRRSFRGVLPGGSPE